MEKTTLYLPGDLQRSLREISRLEHRPQAAIIREALERYVAAHERPWPKSIGAADDGRVAARDSETWLRERWSHPTTRPPRRTSGR